MDRSIGIEKTVQVSQFSPVKVSTYVNNIPDTLWAEDDFVERFSQLLLVQTYKILYNERLLSETLIRLKNSNQDPGVFLNEAQNEIAESLNLKDIVLNVEVKFEEK
jgi:hypothetical protein